MHGLGNQKDQYFLAHLAAQGVAPYEAAIALVHKLRAQEIKTAVVSSSNNCEQVLEAAGLTALFDVRVDGRDVKKLGLDGKPAPDAFLEAAQRLGVHPSRAVVVEDAIAGVEAGRAGRFGLVIGVDRQAQARALRQGGAQVVVTDLGQIHVAVEPPAAWSLVFDDFDAAQEGTREALCTLGNGYFATRGAAPGAVADGVHYPGTYLAGGYNRLETDLSGRVVENEDLVNLPNWVALGLRVAGQGWFDFRTVKLLSYRQELDLRRGVLLRDVRFEDEQGRRSSLRERRLVSMANLHLGAVELSLTAENWAAAVTVRSALDGRVTNTGARLYRKFDGQHLASPVSEVIDGNTVALRVRTSQSNLQIALAARTRTLVDGKPVDTRRRVIEAPGSIAEELELAQGQTLVVEKVAALYTSRDQAISECALAARTAIARAGTFAAELTDHVHAWQHLWRQFEVHVEPADPGFKVNVPMLLRLHMLHLLQTVSPNSIGLDIGVPARGWTGEAYQGHVFWDELFIFPFFNYRMPEITRSLLMYRFRRLGEARAAARRAGCQGAMFPWQSGSDGREETQAANLNPRSKRWVPDHSYLQRHVGSAIAYNAWQYFQVTHDLEFLHSHGAELILEIARFWSSFATFNPARERYEIRGVVGPDEFHDAYPGSSAPGIDNNAYTNLMAVWVLGRALEVLGLFSEMRRAELTTRLGLTAGELARWGELSRKMYVPFHDQGIISQFEGYERLRELDWVGYRARYGNIQRLDLILEAEHDSANHYKLSKQADVLMLFYLFSAEELRGLFEHLGYPFEHETIPRNVAYYAPRASYGSTLCRVAHAWVLARSDRPRAMDFLVEALQSDVGDVQQGTTAEGVHLGAMAGTVDLVQRVSTGSAASSSAGAPASFTSKPGDGAAPPRLLQGARCPQPPGSSPSARCSTPSEAQGRRAPTRPLFVLVIPWAVAHHRRSAGLRHEWEGGTTVDIEALKAQLKATSDPVERLRIVKLLGVAFAAAGNAADSRRAWEAAFKFAPNDLEVVHTLRLAVAASGDPRGALDWFHREAALTTEEPERARLFKELGEHFQNRLSDLDNAQKAFAKARQLDANVFAPPPVPASAAPEPTLPNLDLSSPTAPDPSVARDGTSMPDAPAGPRKAATVLAYPGLLAGSLLRQWWRWRTKPRGRDWLFAAFTLFAAGTIGLQVQRQRNEQRAYLSLDECLTTADLTCANLSLVRLEKLGAGGPRLRVGRLRVEGAATGWQGPAVTSLRALHAELGPQGTAGAEVLLALGDAEEWNGHADLARGHWEGARGKGRDPFVELRLSRQEQRAAEQARSEKELREKQDAERLQEQSNRLEETARSKLQRKNALELALGQIQQDFAKACDAARSADLAELQIRLRLLGSLTSGIPAEEQTRLQAAFAALNQAGNASQRIVSTRQELLRVRDANYPAAYREQRYRELDRRVTDEEAKLESALALADEQFKHGLGMLRLRPVEVVAPLPLRVTPLGGN